jgi:alkylated DNA repair protein (DNA oxidative demethylase)
MLFNTIIHGFEHHRDYLSIARQKTLLEACRRVAHVEPLWTPKFAGKGFLVDFALQNTNCGKYGWLGDASGFRYTTMSRSRPTDPWPTIPREILEVVHDLAPGLRAENCLINHYSGPKSHLGMHQDKTERNRTAPIVSISLGQTAIFQIGGLRREDPVTKVALHTGDVIVMGGGLDGARNAFHGIECLIPGFDHNKLEMKYAARVNITVRQVDV